MVLGKEKLKTLVTSSELYLVFDQFFNTRDRNPYILLVWTVVGGTEVPKPGNSSVVFGSSLCATSVLGGKVFGQASMESFDRWSGLVSYRTWMDVAGHISSNIASNFASNVASNMFGNISSNIGEKSS